MKLKVIAMSIAGFLLVALIVFGVIIKQEDSHREREYKRWQEETLEIEVEHRNIKKQIQDLDEEYENKTLPKATTQVLFTDLNKGVYEECFPILEKFGYTGTLTVSSKQLPGKKGCITKAQYRKLIEKGWDVCIQWESQTDVKKWWKDLREELEKLDIEYENVIYFPKETYKKNLDKQLSELGFQILISEKGDQESPLQTQYENGIWHIYGMGSMTKQPKKWLKEAVAQDANIIFLSSFKLEHQLYNESSFVRMLDSFEECVIGDELIVCDVIKAREHYKIRQSGIDEEVEKQYLEDKEKLGKKLKKTEERLEELYTQY